MSLSKSIRTGRGAAPVALAMLALAMLSACTSETSMSEPSSESGMLMYVGTYTKDTSAGIYGFRFDPATGHSQPLDLAADVREPSFLALHPSEPNLYAVSETDDFDDAGSGSVSAFRIDVESGDLERLNEVSSKGGWPCHLNVDQSGSMVIAANYKSGTVASFPIEEDGRLGGARSVYQHEGSGSHDRQAGPHAHSANFSADARFAFFCDLGIDKVMVYSVDPPTASLAPNDPASASVPPGAGPRHLAFHPNGNFAYVINELASTVTRFTYDAATGALEPHETVSTLPEGYDGESYTAEIMIDESGRWLYGSNRGHNSITVFSIDSESGALEEVAHVPTGGDWPRFFTLDPSGKFLLVANQNSDDINVFRIDPDSGVPAALQSTISIDAPVCIVFRPA